MIHFFEKIPKSVFLALIRRFWYLIIYIHRGFYKPKNLGSPTILKILEKFYRAKNGSTEKAVVRY